MKSRYATRFYTMILAGFNFRLFASTERRTKDCLNPRMTAVGALLFFGSLASAVHADVEYPVGTQTFESMSVGADINTLIPWFTVNTPPESPFTVVAANDVLGTPTTRGSSTRWLRVTDQDATNVQNRFYSPAVIAPDVENYTWLFYVNLETMPPGGADTKPKLTIQHNNSPFANAWGIEFTSTGANLIVLGIGGTAASTPLYTLGSPTGIGDWVRLTLHVDFDSNTVSASANGGPSASLPINLVGTADKKVHRFCFRGEGTGNASRMLIDDVSVFVGRPVPAPALSGSGVVVMASSLLIAVTMLTIRARRARPG